MLGLSSIKCEHRFNPICIDTLTPVFSWIVESDNCNIMQMAFHIVVFNNDEIVWDSGKRETDCSINICYEGNMIKPCERYEYKVKIWDNKNNESPWYEGLYFETGLLENDWSAKWISANEDNSYMRHSFSINGKIKKARAYVTALGIHDVNINGKKITEDLFMPGWTEYKERVQYQVYDVKSLLNEGKNVIGAILGNGWYIGYIGWSGQNKFYGDKTALLIQIKIDYENGETQYIISDEKWKCFKSPILMSEIYLGETYDARKEIQSWDLADFNDKEWNNVKTINPEMKVIAQQGVSVRKIEYIKPVNILKTPKNEIVLDMGQNMVGFIRFSVSGKQGDKVVLKHGEVLDADGNFYNANLRKAKQRIEYILKGDDIEIFEPHFTFQGFRYVLIEEYPGEIDMDSFVGVVVHSDMEQTGSFECSNPFINQLQHNILWGQKGNFVDIPTDCPQRDERMGWTGDAQVFIRTACFNMNTFLFYKKWLQDLKTEHLNSGIVPRVVPFILSHKWSPTGYGDAAVICPWTLYLVYGDKRILKDHYESMKLWVEYIYSLGENKYTWNNGVHLGDWLALDAPAGSSSGATSGDLIATAFYAYSVQLLVKTAKALGMYDDYDKYSVMHKKIVREFEKEFITLAGRLVDNTQTAYIMAIMFDLVPKKHKQRIESDFIKLIERHDYHLTSGFFGASFLCFALNKIGRADIAYKILLQTDYPSWLYPITKGATTIWEHWNSIKPDGTFVREDMLSFNHYAFGAVGDWLYRGVCGINTSEYKAGYKEIIFSPNICRDLYYAKAEYKSVYGLITLRWDIKDNKLWFKVTVPHNTSAEFVFPKGCIDYGRKIKLRSGKHEIVSNLVE